MLRKGDGEVKLAATARRAGSWRPASAVCMNFPIYLVLDACVLVSESALVLNRRSTSAPAVGPSADRGSVRMLWIVTVLAITAGHEIALRHIGPFLSPVLFWQGAGVALFASGLTLRFWAIHHLGRFFTVDVAIAQDHRVVDDGPYRLVRHPSYTALLLEYAGIGCTLRSVTGWLVMMLPILVALLYRVRIEEAALANALGEPYRAYLRRTKRLVPGIF
jgi:protein-S-isoprenylcysteine O-methyltransferase